MLPKCSSNAMGLMAFFFFFKLYVQKIPTSTKGGSFLITFRQTFSIYIGQTPVNCSQLKTEANSVVSYGFLKCSVVLQ